MLKPTKVKIVKKIYSFSPSREGCILVLRVEDVRSKQNEIGINWGGGGVQRSINRQQPMGSKKKEVFLSIANSQRVCAHSYYVLCRYVCACAQTPIIWFLESCTVVLRVMHFSIRLANLFTRLALLFTVVSLFNQTCKPLYQTILLLFTRQFFTFRVDTLCYSLFCRGRSCETSQSQFFWFLEQRTFVTSKASNLLQSFYFDFILLIREALLVE